MAMRLQQPDGGNPTSSRRKTSPSFGQPGYWSSTGNPYSSPSGPYSQKEIDKAGKRGIKLSPVEKGRTVSTKNVTVAPSTRSSKKSTAPKGPSAAEKQAASAARRAAAAAERQERAATRAANNSARSSAQSDYDSLTGQIEAKQAQRATNRNALDALKTLVGPKGGLARSRNVQLANIDRQLNTKLGQLMKTFDTSLKDFRTNLRDNEKSEADSSSQNLQNRARESSDLATQALSQGAGESDVLGAQLAALRNWAANQSDVNRSFFDTRTSINSGITDLNNSTRTGRINEEQSANASRGATWSDFWEDSADAYTQMGNLGQQNYLLGGEIGSAKDQRKASRDLLKWLDAGNDYSDYEAPGSKKKKKGGASAKLAGSGGGGEYRNPYNRKAAEAASQAWRDPGISKATQNWAGAAQSQGRLNSSMGQIQGAAPARKRPEGAGLRRW